MKKVFSFILLAVLISCNGKDSSSGESAQMNAETQTLISKFMELVNNHRKSLGLKALIHADNMALIALGHSEDMASQKVAFGHTGFSGRCDDAREAMNGGNLCSENVASGQKTAEAVFDSWMNSSSHRANIENARVTHCGVAMAKSPGGTPYWTHLFLEL